MHSEEETSQLVEAGFEYVCLRFRKQQDLQKTQVSPLKMGGDCLWRAGRDLNPSSGGDITRKSPFFSALSLSATGWALEIVFYKQT